MLCEECYGKYEILTVEKFEELKESIKFKLDITKEEITKNDNISYREK